MSLSRDRFSTYESMIEKSKKLTLSKEGHESMESMLANSTMKRLDRLEKLSEDILNSIKEIRKRR